MPHIGPHYAVLDAGGNVMGVERSVEHATQLAEELAPGAPIAVQYLDERDAWYQQNPVAAEDMPMIAFANCRLPKISDKALDMSLEEAHQRLLPYFQGLMKRGVATVAYDKISTMADSWIGQNYKTKKKLPGQPLIKVMGVTLVPAAHPRQAAEGTGPYAHLHTADTKAKRTEGVHMIGRWKRELPKAFDRKATLCTGSNQACRDSCLVFAGQNASELYNSYRKVAQTMSLLNEPEAFVRMLVESIDKWRRSREVTSGGIQPYMRMNVLSDIPWELVCPWLFDYFESLQFYDYTKVPGRRVPVNYDLTFSVSGTNTVWAQEEINLRNRRIAVVFLGHKKRGASWAPVKLKGPKLLAGVPLPKTFWGLPVVDGDISDVRPLDPEPCCVGLRWKTPSGKRAGVTVELEGHAFVVPVYVVSDDLVSGFRSGGRQSWEGEEPNPAVEQWLICPVTPRFQPIDHDVAQAVG